MHLFIRFSVEKSNIKFDNSNTTALDEWISMLLAVSNNSFKSGSSFFGFQLFLK